MAAAAGAYPAQLTLEAPLQVARWRPLFAWVLAIPHLLVSYVLNLVAEVTVVVSWFAILFTGKDIEGLQGVRCMAIRYGQRAILYAGFLYEPYPPFSFDTTGADPGDLAGMRVDITPALEGRNRVTTFFRILLVIPHVIVMYVLGIVAFIAYLIGGVAVLITGGWPEGLRAFIVKVLRWGLRLNAYMFLLTDEYPPFALD